MKSHRNAAKNPEIIKIRPPYSTQETLYLKEIINGGLRDLVDVGQGVNYEEFCDSIVTSIPKTVYAPEFRDYWLYWKNRFIEKTGKKHRKKIFELCISDLKAKGLLPNNTSGLTGNFSMLIEEIIQKSPTV